MKYEVLVNGKSVWTRERGPNEFDREVFPEEYRGRPEKGTITLLTDDEVISVSVPLPDDYEPGDGRLGEGGGFGQGTVTVPGDE